MSNEKVLGRIILMTNINTFSKIILDNLAHIVHVPHPSTIPPVQKKEHKHGLIDDFRQIGDLKLEKKYNLIYAGTGFDLNYDPLYSRKARTDAVVKVVMNNPDKIFMIIDNDRLNWQILEEFENCQVWKRKYFSDCYYMTASKIKPDLKIHKNKKHWFCACMGRADVFRTGWFHWFYDNNLLSENKVSYLATDWGRPNRPISTDKDTVRAMYMQLDGREELKNLIPYNNYETEIPDLHKRTFAPRPIFDCLLNIVQEGFATAGNTDISEKSLDCIIHGNVPVIISAPGTMKKFQDLGMIVPDYIDWHIWDDIPVDQLNYSKIDIIRRQLLKLFSKHTIVDIAEDWYPYALRNLEKFNNLASRCLEEEKEICRWILTTTHNLSNPKFQSFY